MNPQINNILTTYIPYGFVLFGIIVFIVGIINFLGQKESAGRTTFNGVILVVIGVGLKYIIPFVLGLLK